VYRVHRANRRFHLQGKNRCLPEPRALAPDGLRRCGTKCAVPWPPVRSGTGKSSCVASAVRSCHAPRRGFHTGDTQNVALARALFAVLSALVFPQSGIPLPAIAATQTPTGKLMLTVLGRGRSIEREMMLERQREGIANAKSGRQIQGWKLDSFFGKPISGNHRRMVTGKWRSEAAVNRLQHEIGPSAIEARHGKACGAPRFTPQA
jgi:hypothetical protein